MWGTMRRRGLPPYSWLKVEYRSEELLMASVRLVGTSSGSRGVGVMCEGFVHTW